MLELVGKRTAAAARADRQEPLSSSSFANDHQHSNFLAGSTFFFPPPVPQSPAGAHGGERSTPPTTTISSVFFRPRQCSPDRGRGRRRPKRRVIFFLFVRGCCRCLLKRGLPPSSSSLWVYRSFLRSSVPSPEVRRGRGGELNSVQSARSFVRSTRGAVTGDIQRRRRGRGEEEIEVGGGGGSCNSCLRVNYRIQEEKIKRSGCGREREGGEGRSGVSVLGRSPFGGISCSPAAAQVLKEDTLLPKRWPVLGGKRI